MRSFDAFVSSCVVVAGVSAVIAGCVFYQSCSVERLDIHDKIPDYQRTGPMPHEAIRGMGADPETMIGPAE